MKTKYAITLSLVLGTCIVQAARAADENLDAATKARIERFEKGPATIDVSK